MEDAHLARELQMRYGVSVEAEEMQLVQGCTGPGCIGRRALNS